MSKKPWTHGNHKLTGSNGDGVVVCLEYRTDSKLSTIEGSEKIITISTWDDDVDPVALAEHLYSQAEMFVNGMHNRQ